MDRKIEQAQIWVLGSVYDDLDYTLQLISKGKKLAEELGKQLVIIEFGVKQKEVLHKYLRCGADIVLFYEFETIKIELVKEIFSSLLKKYYPIVVLGCSDGKNRELIAGTATRLELGLTAECIEISFDREVDRFVFSRTAVNDSTVANITSIGVKIQICTVKRDIFIIEERQIQADDRAILKCTYEEKQIDRQEGIVKLLLKEKVEENRKQRNINSRITVGIGRGAASSIKKVLKLADMLHANVGVTRCLVDDGIFQREYQIGQSGNAISGDTYIAFGISGATQHIVGLKNVKQIIAVNRDKNAPIFQFADVAVIGDLDEFCNCMIKVLSEKE